MKNTFAILCFLFGLQLVSCKTTNQVNQTINSEKQTIESFAQSLFEYIIEDNKTAIIPYITTPDLVRNIAPNEVKNKTDKEIQNEMIDAQSERLNQNAEKVRKDISENNIKLTSVNYDGFKLFPEDAQGSIEVMNIKLKSGNKEGAIPITYTQFNNQYYVFEILISHDIFKE